jgi:hypothetical protein
MGFVEYEGEKVIHVPDREEIVSNIGVVSNKEFVEFVFIEGTVHDGKGGAKGAAHRNADGLAQEVSAGGEVDVFEVKLHDGFYVAFSQIEAMLVVSTAISKARAHSPIFWDNDTMAAGECAI